MFSFKLQNIIQK
ncbi:hypothetical protein PFDG_04766 [Plasmodium falciparum Dd2]|uniref:Uncharacterized protein n=1 Tax=Plasmodium falciparum (isolate Dd2) TaxID=57267 RepID=A0A0L7M8S2_PLAF4|nr:hypothetical protein PFDG_04766 [Plasmodium falciparum Dd2]